VNLTLNRQAVADALNTVAGLNVSARPKTAVRGLDGWVTVGRVTPSTFTLCMATFTAVVLLAADELAAETLIESLTVPCINALTAALNTADVSVEPATVLVGNQSSPMYALTITLTLEVD
jgi:hypothetical protein